MDGQYWKGDRTMSTNEWLLTSDFWQFLEPWHGRWYEYEIFIASCTYNIYDLENERWLLGDMIDHVGIYGSKVAEGLSGFNAGLVQSVKTISGTTSYLVFVPKGGGTLLLGNISQDINTDMCSGLEYTMYMVESAPDIVLPNSGQYVLGEYVRKWYAGHIIEISAENRDVQVDFMRRSGPVAFGNRFLNNSWTVGLT